MALVEEIDAIIRCLREGRPLPEEYKEVLFPAQGRECELTYRDKRSKAAVLADAGRQSPVPLRVARTFAPGGGERPEGGWNNLLISGDNLKILRALYQDTDPLIRGQVRGKVKLIYIDPPFATEKEFHASVGQKAYADKVSGAEFVEFLRRRLILMKELLAPEGFLCVHLDYRKKHYIKVVLDEIFGEHNFRNEIAVKRVKKSIREKKMVRKLNEEFDTLLLYANSEPAQLLPPMRAERKEARWHAFDAPEIRTGMDYDLFGRRPKPNRHWTWEEPRARAAAENYARYEREHLPGESIEGYCARIGQKLEFLRPKATTGTPEYYIEASDMVLCNNLWSDISAYSFSNGYPTEKSEALLTRIVGMTTAPGDLVLDCFAGSGTTLAVAEKMQRRWIGCDIGRLSLYTMQRRLLQLDKSGDPARPGRKYKGRAAPFSVLTMEQYAPESEIGLPAQEYTAFAKLLFQVEEPGGTAGNGVPVAGQKRGYPAVLYPYWEETAGRGAVDEAYLRGLHRRMGGKAPERVYLIAPANRVAFGDDYYEIQGTRYCFLKIPDGMLEELRRARPQDAAQEKRLMEAVGFHFRRPLEVASRLVRRPDGCWLAVSRFWCEHGVDKKGRPLKNLEGLSLVLLDERPGSWDEPFRVSRAFSADELTRVFPDGPGAEGTEELWLPLAPETQGVRVLYLDLFGDEFTETLT